MAQPFALNMLREIAETQTESAAANLGTLMRQLQQQEAKLTLLLDYREDYRQRLARAGERGLDAAGLRNFYDFLERLEQAVSQQQSAIAEARAKVEGGRRDWQVKQRKFKAFDTLAQRSDMAAQRREACREQKLQDEFASRSGHAKSQTRR